MATVLKHVGKIKNTDVRCAVVFRQDPEDKSFAHIVETESLPMEMHDSLMDVINKEAQAPEVENLGDVLHRKMFPGGGQMLTTLYAQRRIRKIKSDLVIMYPLPNRPMALDVLNEAIDAQKGITAPKADAATQVPPAAPQIETDVKASLGEEGKLIARNLMIQAVEMEATAKALLADAAKKKAEAAKHDPSLAQVAAPVTEAASMPKAKKTKKVKEEATIVSLPTDVNA